MWNTAITIYLNTIRIKYVVSTTRVKQLNFIEISFRQVYRNIAFYDMNPVILIYISLTSIFIDGSFFKS